MVGMHGGGSAIVIGDESDVTCDPPLLGERDHVRHDRHDRLSGALATDAKTASPVGTYDITQGTLTASANYTLTYVGGVLTVKTSSSTGSNPPQSTGSDTPPLTGPNTASPTGTNASVLANANNGNNEPLNQPLPSGSDPANWGSVLDNGSSSQPVLLQDPRFANVLVCVATGQPSACTVTPPTQ